MKKIIVALASILIIGCKKESVPTDNYSIDLSVMYDNSINSYKTELDRGTVMLLNKKDEIGRLYELKLNETEFKDIQNEISKISEIKCDSTANQYADGMNYVLILKRANKTIKLVSNTCDKYEKVDKFVLRLVKMFDNRKKDEFFESVILPPPPELPESSEDK